MCSHLALDLGDRDKTILCLQGPADQEVVQRLVPIHSSMPLLEKMHSAKCLTKGWKMHQLAPLDCPE